MNTTLEAGNQTLLRQAPITANEYLMSAIGHIDQAHPELTDATASPIDSLAGLGVVPFDGATAGAGSTSARCRAALPLAIELSRD